jgi:hypothetical protein
VDVRHLRRALTGCRSNTLRWARDSLGNDAAEVVWTDPADVLRRLNVMLLLGPCRFVVFERRGLGRLLPSAAPRAGDC